MSLIPCLDACLYQQEGVCLLTRTAPRRGPRLTGECVYFSPRHSPPQQNLCPEIPIRQGL